MTANKEDYLKVIYEAGGEKTTVPNKVIAEKLGVAPASVTEMLTRLKREGLIEYRAYKGSVLTQEGLASCLTVVRSHRLWEVFLIRHLGYSWSEAHEEAHLLEHVAPARMIDRLDQFLNYPVYCPHGSVIPGADARVRRMCTLDRLSPGDRAIVGRVTEEKDLLDYLQERGVTIGAGLRVLEVEPYEGPILLELEGETVRLSHKAALQIEVEPVAEES